MRGGRNVPVVVDEDRHVEVKMCGSGWPPAGPWPAKWGAKGPWTSGFGGGMVGHNVGSAGWGGGMFRNGIALRSWGRELCSA